MPKYLITFVYDRTEWTQVEVDADNQEKAEELAWEEVHTDKVEWEEDYAEANIDSVEVVDEEKKNMV